jgi:hypothetical protein
MSGTRPEKERGSRVRRNQACPSRSTTRSRSSRPKAPSPPGAMAAQASGPRFAREPADHAPGRRARDDPDRQARPLRPVPDPPARNAQGSRVRIGARHHRRRLTLPARPDPRGASERASALDPDHAVRPGIRGDRADRWPQRRNAADRHDVDRRGGRATPAHLHVGRHPMTRCDNHLRDATH